MLSERELKDVIEKIISEIKIDNGNTFFKMLNTLIEARKSQGNKNVDFKFENILELISPKKVIEDIKQTRKEIAYIYQKYEELDDENPKKLELGDKLNTKFEEASEVDKFLVDTEVEHSPHFI